MLGKQYKGRNGQIGTVEEINGIKRLIVRNFYGRKVQSINLKDIDLNKFKEVKK